MAVTIVFVALVVWYLASIVNQSRPAFSSLGISWIFQKVWDPSHGKYGLLPFILGTIETTAIALVLAVPIGLGTAIALAHLVPGRLRAPLSTAVELLAAVPSVVYGLWGLIVLAPVFRSTVEPFLSSAFGWTGLFNGPEDGVGLLLAGVILFIMVLPTMVAISRDVLVGGAPRPYRRGNGPGRHPVAGTAQGGGAGRPHRPPRRVHPGHGPRPRRDGGSGPGHRQFAVHRPLGRLAGRHPGLVDRQQLRRGHGHRRATLFGAALVLLVIGIAVNAIARVLVRSTARGGAASVAVA